MVGITRNTLSINQSGVRIIEFIFTLFSLARKICSVSLQKKTPLAIFWNIWYDTHHGKWRRFDSASLAVQLLSALLLDKARPQDFFLKFDRRSEQNLGAGDVLG